MIFQLNTHLFFALVMVSLMAESIANPRDPRTTGDYLYGSGVALLNGASHLLSAKKRAGLAAIDLASDSGKAVGGLMRSAGRGVSNISNAIDVYTGRTNNYSTNYARRRARANKINRNRRLLRSRSTNLARRNIPRRSINIARRR